MSNIDIFRPCLFVKTSLSHSFMISNFYVCCVFRIEGREYSKPDQDGGEN